MTEHIREAIPSGAEQWCQTEAALQPKVLSKPWSKAVLMSIYLNNYKCHFHFNNCHCCVAVFDFFHLKNWELSVLLPAFHSIDGYKRKSCFVPSRMIEELKGEFGSDQLTMIFQIRYFNDYLRADHFQRRMSKQLLFSTISGMFWIHLNSVDRKHYL